METRAHHLAVGLFVLVLIAALAGFVIWISKFNGEQNYAYYTVRFSEDVTGLSVDGPVRYRGVTVGRVTDIRIDPDNPIFVRITIQVSPDTPVVTDTVASLEAQGITGVLYVLLKGGTQGAPRMKVTDLTPYPEIPGAPGKFEALLASAPALLEHATQLVDRVTLMFSDQNQAAIANTLNNLQGISATFNDPKNGVGPTLDSISDAAISIDAMSEQVRTLATNLDKQVGGLVGASQKTLDDLHKLTTSFEGAADEIHDLVAENRRPLNDFAQSGLYELTQMASEMRTLIATLTRISTQFERDPARFLFGDRQKGYEAQ
ncbi:MlaD family protein [Hypericibacter sp.]|uniref:MlaD family protein n=1 Tax=Hypericibacter sp. TaxID=2705401 RepID=UPI003D6C892B